MKIATIIGARPQFIKAAAVSRAIAAHNRAGCPTAQAAATIANPVAHNGGVAPPPVIEEILIHTGQHYDDGMSAVFFRELDIPEPKYNLEIGSGPHGRQTGRMLAAIEEVFLSETPDWVLIYGDTNSTLAGADRARIAAAVRSFKQHAAHPPIYGDGHAAE